MTRMKYSRKKILFALILLVATVAALEIGTRAIFAFIVGPRTLLYGTSAFRDARDIPSAVMKTVGYTPPTPERPVADYQKFAPNEIKFDTDENGDRFSPTINKRGFRGPDFLDAKKPGVIRVVILGESSTFGYHDRDDETYPYYLQQRLNASGKAYEVINLGIPHIGSEQILSLFVSEALPLNPDIVTLYAGWNDSGRGLLEVVESREDFAGVYELVRQRMLVLALLDSLLYYSGTQLYTREDLGRLETANSEVFLNSIAALNDECRKRGIVFIPATQQSTSQLIPREELKGVTYQKEVDFVRDRLKGKGVPRRALSFLVHDSIMKGLREWARKEEVPLVDVITALDQDRSVLLTYVHSNPAGNRAIAEEFEREILKRSQ